MTCPNGHSLPNDVSGVRCTETFCAEANKGLKPKAPRPKKGGAREPPPAKRATTNAITRFEDASPILWDPEQEVSRQEESQKINKAIGRYEARKAFVKLPDTSKMTPEEAKDWVQKRLDALAPEAVARIEKELKLGSDDSSLKAAYDVLDRTGFGKREGANPIGAPIIIVNQGSGGSETYVPAFLKRDDKK